MLQIRTTQKSRLRSILQQHFPASVRATLVGGLDEADDLNRLLWLDGRRAALKKGEERLAQAGVERLGLRLDVYGRGRLPKCTSPCIS